MVKASKGPKRRTRHKLKLKTRLRGKRPTTSLIQEFKTGDRVLISPNPQIQKAIPFRRFFNKAGVVLKRIGNAYMIKIKENNKEKSVITRPVHLRRMK